VYEWLHECYWIEGEETGHFFMHTIFISLRDVTAISWTFLRIWNLIFCTKRTTGNICYIIEVEEFGQYTVSKFYFVKVHATSITNT
jgi:hypothetical protein